MLSFSQEQEEEKKEERRKKNVDQEERKKKNKNKTQERFLLRSLAHNSHSYLSATEKISMRGKIP